VVCSYMYPTSTQNLSHSSSRSHLIQLSLDHQLRSICTYCFQFFSKALSKELGYKLLDESEHLSMHTGPERSGEVIKITGSTPLEDILKIHDPVVLQRPMWSHLVHKFQPDGSVFVAFLARNCLDVFRSQNRIFQGRADDRGWTCKFGRTEEWAHYHQDPELRTAFDAEHDMICTIKQQAYKRLQRVVMAARGVTTAPIAYSSFSSLRGYLEPTVRANFTAKQTKAREGGS